MNRDCPICSSKNTDLLYDRIDEIDHTHILRCVDCDLDFLETWNDIEHVKSLYEGDNYIFSHNISSSNEFLKYDEYTKRANWLKPYLNQSSSVLEIGCGDGKFINLIKDQVALIEGVELSPPQVRKLRDEGIKCYDTMIDEMEPERTYDIICMFALLEHVPNVKNFLEKLKGYTHKDTQIFIEVPNLNDPLVKSYEIEEFKEFYYRAIHLYYFTPKSLSKLLDVSGYTSECTTSQQASLTNHFHWMHKKRGQKDANAMTSAIAPVEVNDDFPINEILDKTDDFYRKALEDNMMGDLLLAKVKLKQ